MTSPAISKSPEKQKSQNKSPTHSANAEQAPPDGDSTVTASSSTQQSDPFSWFRIFKLADLMMKQGC